jgi:hypothetical protein
MDKLAENGVKYETWRHFFLVFDAERQASGVAGSGSEVRDRVDREGGRIHRHFSRPPSEPDVT